MGIECWVGLVTGLFGYVAYDGSCLFVLGLVYVCALLVLWLWFVLLCLLVCEGLFLVVFAACVWGFESIVRLGSWLLCLRFVNC